MRKLNSQEKIFCKIILDSSGTRQIPLQLFFRSEVKSQWIDILVSNKDTAFFFDPNVYGEGVIDYEKFESSVSTLVIAINLLKLLEKESLIYLIKSGDLGPHVIIGNQTAFGNLIGGAFVDESIIDDVLRYAACSVIVTEDFKALLKNDFKSSADIYSAKQMEVAFKAVELAVISSIITLIGILGTVLVSLIQSFPRK